MLHKKHLLTSLGQVLDNSFVAIAMVIPLPPSYSTLHTILMSSDSALSTEKVIAAIVEHEKMLESEAKHTMLAACVGKGKGKDKQKLGDKKPTCAHCKKQGHKKDKCYKLKGTRRTSATSSRPS